MALKVLQENTSKAMKCTVEWNGEYGFEVKDRRGNKFIVNLNNKTCTCRSWMLKGIPYCHAIAVLHFRKLEPIDYVADCYTKDTYLKTYNSFIQPVTNMAMWPKSTNPPVLPPEIKKLPCRPRKCGRKELTGKLSKTGVEMTCSLCHAKGHNKKGYPMNPQSVRGRGMGRVETDKYQFNKVKCRFFYSTK
ncbi:uncharacterized protein LOC132612927 [Lycium barbarum]|uniref:uncharacterized protein LOC132612927 n=1 Tax=Lycium barbarum TaxID=112863 RepID=UPI00293F41F4|nr:uncharacterized protein LOC132612927 [Lycium barbarum]